MELMFEFARILLFCFAGELCHTLLPLPIPASVYGYAYAADTGAAMREGRVFVDLYYESYEESVKSAVIPVTVYIIDEETAAKYQQINDEILAADTVYGK